MSSISMECSLLRHRYDALPWTCPTNRPPEPAMSQGGGEEQVPVGCIEVVLASIGGDPTVNFSQKLTSKAMPK